MGNKYNKSYTPKSYFDNIKNHQYKPCEFRILMEKLLLFNKAINSNFRFDENANLNTNIKDNFLKKYGIYLGIERFFIPIIGIINSGKSTFMNNFLNLKNILQIGDKTTTRFISIIRHDKNAQIPELYNVKIEKRNDNGYNFKENGENLLNNANQNLAKIIESLNDDIKLNEKSDKYLTNPDKYFLIIKTKIPIFQGEYEEYGDLIDFLDIPGLDEIKNNGSNIFDDFIQVIFSNILFPLFIFDIQGFEDDNTKNILIKYLDYYFNLLNCFGQTDKTYDKGIFILNKIDLLNEDINEILKQFKANLSNIAISNGKMIEIPLKYGQNFFGISAKTLSVNNNNNFFDMILEDIIKESKNSDDNSFKKFLKKYLLSNYKLDLNKAEEENINLSEQLKVVNSILKNKCKNFSNPQLNLKEFTYLSKNNNNINKESTNQNKEIISAIKKKILIEFKHFLNFDFEGLMVNINEFDLDNKYKIKENTNFGNKEFITNFNSKALNLFKKPKEDYKQINEIIKFISDFKNFYTQKKIRILFIGKISSGKTSLLNSIIGNNFYLLETTMKECTKSIFIIKYSKKIKFCESRLIQNQFGNYFKDIENTSIYDPDKIRETIKNLNKESKFKYYTLYIQIEALENIENKEEIELIDLPGIKQSLVNDDKLDLNNLINLSDGFIFSFNSVNLDDESSHFIMSEIINDIKKRNDNFDFKNCLFNLNYIDEIDDNLIDEKINKFKEDIITKLNSNIYMGSFKERLAIKEKILSAQDINISCFSNKYYKQYQNNINNIDSMSFLNENNSPQEIYEELIEEYEDMQEFIIDEVDNNILNEKIRIIQEKLNNYTDNEYIIKIAKFTICLLKNKKQLSRYKSSKADLFFAKFMNEINLSQNSNFKIKFIKFNNYLMSLLFRLYYINELCTNEHKLDDYKINIEIKANIIEKEYKDIIDRINLIFENKLKIIDEYQKYSTELISNEKTISKEMLFEKLKSLGIENKINNLMKKLDNEIRKIQINYYYFCIKKIIEIINDLSEFQGTLDIISYNFKKKSGNLGIIISSISGGLFSVSSFGVGIAGTVGAIAIGTLGVVGSGLGLLAGGIIIGYQFYQKNKSNDKKIVDYFNEVKKHIEKIRKKYLNSIKNQKEQYILELKNSKNISLEEIKYLKTINYQINFKNLLKCFTN